jgi:hypothetical protein
MQLAYPISPVVSLPRLNLGEIEAGFTFDAVNRARDLVVGGVLTFFYALEYGLLRLKDLKVSTITVQT